MEYNLLLKLIPLNDLHESVRTVDLHIYKEKDNLYICRILNHLSDTLFYVNLRIKSAKEICNVLDKKYGIYMMS